MKKFQHLLAATDLSAPARLAAERAARIAAEFGATLDLLHVISAVPVDHLRRLLAEAPADVEKRLEENARAELQRLADRLREQHGVEARHDVAQGSLLARIAEQCDASGADLLVLGARGASFVRHSLLGSTAERLVSRATRPMLVVKQPAHGSYERVLVAVDFSPPSLRALEVARALAPRAGIALLHAFEVPFAEQMRHAGVTEATLRHYGTIARRLATTTMQAVLDAAGLTAGTTTTLLVEGDPSRHIIEQEQVLDRDLVVVGKHGESVVDDFLLGSVTRQVLRESLGDVLVCV